MAGLILAACNSKKEDEPEYTPAMSVAVNSFALKSNSSVMKNLDSVFFSIDLDHAIIFNADSLPAGTKVDKLVADIKFPSTVKSAKITMTGGNTRTGEIDYITASGDSIDFTGNVTLTLTSSDDALSRTYRLKVNVHKQVPDSLMWTRSAIGRLPSASGSPAEQRTVMIGGQKSITMIEEADGTYTAVTYTDPAAGESTRFTPQMDFTPRLRSLTAVGTLLYMLDDEGHLRRSADEGTTWTDTGTVWRSITGGFRSDLLGVTEAGGSPCHDIYPRPEGYAPVPVPEGFPVEGISAFHTFTSAWSSDPIGLFVGGRTASGSLSAATWAYDGSDWAVISNRPLPALESPLIVPYFSYRQTATSWLQTEFSVLLCIGGRLADGSLNPTVYYSYDNGVNWTEGDTLIQLPAYVPAMTEADAVTFATSMEANLSDAWTEKATLRPSAPVSRIVYNVEGDEVSWNCPYIYMFGGRPADGTLNTDVWRAVLARLTFAPLF